LPLLTIIFTTAGSVIIVISNVSSVTADVVSLPLTQVWTFLEMLADHNSWGCLRDDGVIL